MPELCKAEHVSRRHVVVQRDLDVELEPPARPVAVLGADDNMEVGQGVGVIELYLHTRRFVLLQLLYLQISFGCYSSLLESSFSLIPLSLTIYL